MCAPPKKKYIYTVYIYRDTEPWKTLLFIFLGGYFTSGAGSV